MITADNYKELVALDDFLRREIHPEILHGFELVRGVQTSAWGIPPEIAEEGMQPKSMSLPPIESFPAIAHDLRRIQRRFPFHASSFLVHNLAQLRMVETRSPQYPCVTAGQSVGVVYAGGETAHCEFTRPFANLADYDFDFAALWNGPEAEARRRQIKRCFCTHGCFHGPGGGIQLERDLGNVQESDLGVSRDAGVSPAILIGASRDAGVSPAMNARMKISQARCLRHDFLYDS